MLAGAAAGTLSACDRAATPPGPSPSTQTPSAGTAPADSSPASPSPSAQALPASTRWVARDGEVEPLVKSVATPAWSRWSRRGRPARAVRPRPGPGSPRWARTPPWPTRAPPGRDRHRRELAGGRRPVRRDPHEHVQRPGRAGPVAARRGRSRAPRRDHARRAAGADGAALARRRRLPGAARAGGGTALPARPGGVGRRADPPPVRRARGRRDGADLGVRAGHAAGDGAAVAGRRERGPLGAPVLRVRNHPSQRPSEGPRRRRLGAGRQRAGRAGAPPARRRGDAAGRGARRATWAARCC